MKRNTDINSQADEIRANLKQGMSLMHYDFQLISIFFKIRIGKASEDGEALAQAAPGGCGMASREGPQHLPG